MFMRLPEWNGGGVSAAFLFWDFRLIKSVGSGAKAAGTEFVLHVR